MGAPRLSALILPALASAVWAAAAMPGRPTKPSDPKKVISYNRDVRPILSEHCFRCHGPSAKEGQAGLRLDLAESATKLRDGYRVVDPGHAAKSAIMGRLRPEQPELQMPPPDSGVKALTDEEVATIKAWIDQGGKYERLWSLIPPKAPSVPAVADASWPRNPVDRFVLKKLEDQGIKPEVEADRATLLRRATLTLTGLQPTPSELDAFLKDRSKDAYERAVDRLLASPRYGEHQARFWLDAVRYGDTHGLHLDNERAIYPYRDWIVRAFNQDVPYDQFARWQLAGDLLPNPTTDQLIATGYIRMNPTTNEGGAIAEEFQAKNTFDRVDTTSTVFLGMTIACARCHSHKYDPITQADYYRLFAFFNSTADEPLDGNLFTPDPVARAPFPDEDKKMRAMEAGLASFEAKVDLKAAQAWLKERKVDFPTVGQWEVSDQVQAASFDAAYDTESKPANWMPLELKAETPLNFFTKENAYAYLRSSLTSTKDQEVGLRLSSDDGIKVWVNGEQVHANKALRGVGQSFDSLRIKLKSGANELLIKIANSGGPGGVFYGLGDDTDKRAETVAKLQDKPEGQAQLRKLFLEAGPETTAAKSYRSQSKAYAAFLAGIPQTLVARELPKARPAFILRRGEYNLPTEKVERSIPEALGSLPKGAPVDRLGFAQWLTAKDNPLFARVFVNRIWQQHFGTGLVKTAEDFGNQGEWPSHPELLDYLATRFVKDGYSLKKLHRLVLTSAAFRQKSSASPQKRQIDPENRLISRGPRFRLDAEVLRDQALFASGLLYEHPGGKGFKPYQPAGLWEEVAFQESTTAKYVQDSSREIYRRSLYLFWKRTSPHPVMLTFDAPMREMCVVRRARTNTPLQALVTMNEPAFLEASRSFAERLLKAPLGTDAATTTRLRGPAASEPTVQLRVREAFRLALGREPSPAELSTLEGSFERYLERYKAEPEAARELVAVGMTPPDPKLDRAELAAWTLVCSTLFNLDEFLTQH